MTAVSVCFLGCSNINARHIGTLKRLRPDVAFAVASRNVAKARDFGGQRGARDCFGSYEEASRSAYDVMVIGTPPRGHRDLVAGAIDAGKHLLIEKPIFATFDELEAAWTALRGHRGVVMVAENLHYAPMHRRIKSLLRTPELGRPLLVDLIRLGRNNPSGWRADPVEMPLGALHEGGVHWIRRLLDMTSVFETSESDQVVDVFATGPEAPVTTVPREDTTMIIARHRSGLTSRLLHSWAVPWRFRPFDVSKVLLERGAVYFEALGWFGRYYGPDGGQWLWPDLRDRGGFEAMWRDFLAAVETQRPTELTLDHIFADFAYMDAAYRSRASGKPEAPRRPRG